VHRAGEPARHGQTAVRTGDLPGAREAMRAHLREVFADIERIRERSPELFASNQQSTPVRRNIVVWD
jgi:GntR family transcriptional regulator, rspAB operon transcriptional repressor